MMSCIRLYVDPTDDLMVQERKNRLLSTTNIVISFEKKQFSFQLQFWLFLVTAHLTV